MANSSSSSSWPREQLEVLPPGMPGLMALPMFLSSPVVEPVGGVFPRPLVERRLRYEDPDDDSPFPLWNW